MESRDILVVDDSRTVLAMVTDILECQGYSVRQAENGRVALEMVAEERPDLILLDVMMPVLDGPSTMLRLREAPATAGIPVIFLTAKVQQHEIEAYLAQGAAGVICKPFDATSLPDEVRGILRDA